MTTIKYFPGKINVLATREQAEKRIEFLISRKFDQFNFSIREGEQGFYVVGALKENKKKKYYL